ncbi:hypothetical protein [Nisaea sediminum]|uniref:hypothetical protein n=1 Tax=Nisaea sediminum TaxID=2775867 RepID=UPI0018692FD4|nr:hypothetical protein [Nisaea sediminum]
MNINERLNLPPTPEVGAKYRYEFHAHVPAGFEFLDLKNRPGQFRMAIATRLLTLAARVGGAPAGLFGFWVERAAPAHKRAACDACQRCFAIFRSSSVEDVYLDLVDRAVASPTETSGGTP